MIIMVVLTIVAEIILPTVALNNNNKNNKNLLNCKICKSKEIK